MEEIIDAGLGLDYDDLRLDRTNERWVVAGASLRDRVEAILGPEARPWHRIAHLHVVDAHGGQWCDYLRLRDLLRRNSDACRAYEAVKLQLVEEFGDDRKLYTDGKSAIVRSLLDEFE